MKLLLKIVINAVAIWVATVVVPGVSVTGEGAARTAITLLVLGAIFGVVNTVVKPVLTFFSFPFVLLSLGLFLLVINALMLELVAWLASEIGITFTIESFFWSAILAAIVVTLVSWALEILLPES